MSWLPLLSYFFSGVFLANAVQQPGWCVDFRAKPQ